MLWEFYKFLNHKKLYNKIIFLTLTILKFGKSYIANSHLNKNQKRYSLTHKEIYSIYKKIKNLMILLSVIKKNKKIILITFKVFLKLKKTKKMELLNKFINNSKDIQFKNSKRNNNNNKNIMNKSYKLKVFKVNKILSILKQQKKIQLFKNSKIINQKI